jgi:hypothetical protein
MCYNAEREPVTMMILHCSEILVVCLSDPFMRGYGPHMHVLHSRCGVPNTMRSEDRFALIRMCKQRSAVFGSMHCLSPAMVLEK